MKYRVGYPAKTSIFEPIIQMPVGAGVFYKKQMVNLVYDVLPYISKIQVRVSPF